MKQVLVAVGTAKGAYFFRSDEARRNWSMTGPHNPGWEVSAICVDPRPNGRIYAGTTHYAYGATIRSSDDGGQAWREMTARPAHPEGSGLKNNRIWQIITHPTNPDILYAGIDEAGLFVSPDRGESWQSVDGINKFPGREHWHPGAGGLCLHTIVIDPKNPKRMWVGISAVGVMRSLDGGASWSYCNKGLPQFDSGNEHMPKICCVHKIVAHPGDADQLFMQFHGGVFRSTNAGDSWDAIESGLPGNFGFPMAVTQRGELFVAPLEDQGTRVMKDGRLAIYKSTDAGQSWTAQDQGLPREPQYVGVLRDSLAADALSPAGIYFGTSVGDVYASADDGTSWTRLPGSFPRIETIKTAII